MKEKLYGILLLFIVFGCCTADSATFSTAKILLFHPEMQDYHFGLQTFFREHMQPNQKTSFVLELYKKLSAMEKTRQEQILKLRIERQKRIELLSGYDHRYVTETKNEYTEKIRAASIELLNEQEELIFKHFLNPDERNGRLKKILKEINEHTNMAQQKLKLNFLFHDSLQYKIPLETDKIFFPGQESSFHALQKPEIFIGHIFNEIQNSRRLIGLHQPHGVEQDDFAFGIDQEAVRLFLRKYTYQGPYRAVFTNGPDITGEIMSTIYRKHKIPELIAERLAEINYIPDAGIGTEK
jgi:hypothetical protein